MESNTNKVFEKRSLQREYQSILNMLDPDSEINRKRYINPEQMKALQEYDRYNNLRKLSIGSRRGALHALRSFCFVISKPFDEISRKDIEDWMLSIDGQKPSSQIRLHSVIKGFFKWFTKTDDGYPAIVKWIKVSRKFAKTKLPEDLLTAEEILKLINAADNPRDKCIISILVDSGCRVGELQGLRIRDVEMDEFGAIIHVDGKTGERPVRIISAVPVLNDWLNNHPHKNDRDSYLFISLSKNHYGKELFESGILSVVKGLAKKADLKKRVYCHLFRHTAASKDAKKYTEAIMKKKYGWTNSSRMPAVYVTLSNKEVDEEILMKEGIKKPNTEETGKLLVSILCPLCGEKNTPTNLHCSRCTYPIAEDLQQEAKAESTIKAAILKFPEVQAAIKRALEKMNKVVNQTEV